MRVVIVDTGYASYDVESAILEEAGAALDAYPGPADSHADKIAFCRGAHGILVRGTVIDGDFLDAVPGLKAVVRYGVGYDNVDVNAASKRGILVANVQGYASHSVSDHALALILACLRGLRPAADHLRSRFGAPAFPYMPELKDMTLGIVGLGRIGGMLCTKTRGLFKQVLACDPYIPDMRFANLGAVKTGLDALLSTSDVVSIHCNLTEETRLMFDRDTFAKMRPDAILINTARGPLVDEDALLEALKASRLYGVGVDVFWDEPPRANRDELLDHPRVVATGHVAWFSTQAGKELQRRAAENMAAMLRGDIPADCLNPDVVSG
jgi:D-3-phosphoglycerate dehydrogenase